ncbi:MAG: hypothetical protein ACTSUB_07570, partial [Candidatus Thorarchaeota archaeon]
ESDPPALCELCDSTGQALVKCTMCNSYVCPQCMSNEGGFCDVCTEAQCTICGEYLSSRACNECGRLVCETCGIRVNEATTCKVCQAK